MDSFHLLLWAREHAEPGTVLMYHSPPPCSFFTGHDCQSIPYPGDLYRVRDYLVKGGADYLIIDEFGRLYATGPGWFVENSLRPVVSNFPGDFETVFEIPGTEAKVVRVRHNKG